MPDKSYITFLDHFDSFSFNLIDWLSYDFNVTYIRCDDRHALAQFLEHPSPLVLSPGPNTPFDVPQTMSIVQKVLAKVPILGICLGHQILGICCGLILGRHPDPFHGHSRWIYKTMDNDSHDILGAMPARFQAASYNSLVLRSDEILPMGCVVTAKDDFDLIQGLTIKEQGAMPAFGLQFHPESFMSIGMDPIRSQFRYWVEQYTQT